jgi:hypothetical protein
MNLLKKDNFFLGLAMGLLLPLPVYAVFYALDVLLKSTGWWHGLQQPENIYLLSVVGNFLLIRLTFVTWKNQKTGKGVLLMTITLILTFFFLYFKQPR